MLFVPTRLINCPINCLVETGSSLVTRKKNMTSTELTVNKSHHGVTVLVKEGPADASAWSPIPAPIYVVQVPVNQ